MEHRAIGRRVTTPSRPRRETLRKCDDRFMDYGKQMLLAARYSSSYIDSSSRERGLYISYGYIREKYHIDPNVVCYSCMCVYLFVFFRPAKSAGLNQNRCIQRISNTTLFDAANAMDRSLAQIQSFFFVRLPILHGLFIWKCIVNIQLVYKRFLLLTSIGHYRPIIIYGFL